MGLGVPIIPGCQLGNFGTIKMTDQQSQGYQKRHLINRIIRWVTKLAPQKPEMWESQILKQWEQAIPGQFPYMTTDEHQAFAKARLTAFRSNVEWLVVFETLAYVGEADAFIDSVYIYGNKVKRRVEWIEPLCPPPGENEWLPNPFDFEVIIHGHLQHFTPTQADYDRAGIDLNVSISGDIMLDRRVYVLRLLAFILPRHSLFLSQPQLLQVAGRTKVLPVFLQLYEWHHPEPGEKLGPCLQSLARAIAYNRLDLYECPQNLVNTHWPQWTNYFLEH